MFHVWYSVPSTFWCSSFCFFNPNFILSFRQKFPDFWWKIVKYLDPRQFWTRKCLMQGLVCFELGGHMIHYGNLVTFDTSLWVWYILCNKISLSGKFYPFFDSKNIVLMYFLWHRNCVVIISIHHLRGNLMIYRLVYRLQYS